ncbi:MAG: NADPH-dependent mycothiol reductase Mtr [Pseudonocardiales bacterium]|nr:NADPH-dependent mycothiol reductase Mtr [Pseudonocardiales bacterium]
MAHYDLAIIGSGSGNTLVGPELPDWEIAIIEESTFGGTCLNVGCIPTKMYVYAADRADEAAHSSRLGVDTTLDRVRWPDIRDRIFGRIDPISAGGRDYRAHGEPNTTLIEAHASFADARTLRLSTGESITADRIVIATGSRPVVPPVVTASGVAFHTSQTVMRIDELPERIAILGGGYIASEFAHVFASFGAVTTVIARSSPLLRHLDHEIASRFTELAKDRWDVRLDASVASLERSGDAVRLDLLDGSTVEADLLLVATGRTPNSDRLNLRAAGVHVHPDGRVVVDAHQQTTADGIWALGDVCSPHQLKHVSNHEARVVAHNLAHPDAPVESDHRFVPSAVFTHPQLASVGLTEEEAAASGRRFVTALLGYGSTAYGWAMEDTTAVCKLIADPATGQLLGAHLMGEQAATLIQPLIQAMSFGLDVREMARGQYWIHPALSEVVENALLHLRLD